MISKQNVLKVKTESEVRNDIMVYFDKLKLVYFMCSLLLLKTQYNSLQSAPSKQINVAFWLFCLWLAGQN